MLKRGEVRALAGQHRFEPGERKCFGLDLWVTPFKEIDYKRQFSDRFYHTYRCEPPEKWLEKLRASKANIINVHHGTDLNPYINYPFYETAALKEFVEQVHDLGKKVKLYNTVRELTTKIREFEILQSLDYEILEPSKGFQGATLWQSDSRQWIVEQFGDDIIPAWRQEITTGKYAGETDASILTNGQSRLCNYYIEGLDWLI